MAKIKNVYLSDDNKEFATEAEADAHNAGLANAKAIEAYIVEAKLMKAQAGLMRKHIAGYLAFASRPAAPEAA